MATTALQPAFQRISAEDKSAYDLFFDSTSAPNIQGYEKGYSLEKLTALAESAYGVVIKTNPILQEGSPQASVIPGRQWELNQLHLIKVRLSQAIECKRAYYDNHIFGIVTKYVLKFFGKWNDGNTSAIVIAEDFLIRHDTRFPLMKDSAGNYKTKMFFTLTPASWVRDNLDLSRFYNYNPRRPIPIAMEFRYDALNARHPEVFIRG
ncbi:MAG: hypothetical protein HYX67_13190 [Candidatus Melainabacteria bacterium]|nr:hypothetical protein [Candidatus Melainabacteria bacterium]